MTKYLSFIPDISVKQCDHDCGRIATSSLLVAEYDGNVVSYINHMHICDVHLDIYREHYIMKRGYNETTIKFFAKFFKEILKNDLNIKALLKRNKINAYILSN